MTRNVAYTATVTPRQKTALIAVTLVALAFIAFGRTLTQDFAPVDDDLLVTRNLAAQGITGENLRTVFTTFDPELYIPLTFVSFQINYMLAGLSPWMYHLTNILLHALNACLVAWLLSIVTKHKNLSVFAGMLFAVHPLHTEAVAWVAGRKDLLFTAFFLGSFIVYLKAKRLPSYLGSLTLHLLGLLAKVMAATLPAIFLLTDWFHHGKIRKQSLLKSLPFFALSFTLIAVAVFGKERILSNHTHVETILMAIKSTVFYLWKFFLPTGLTMFYPYHGEILISEPAFFLPTLTLSLTLTLAIWSLKLTRTVAYGLAFFLITLAPTFINFHKGGEMYFASDRYPYLPSVGLLFLIVMGLARLPRVTERFVPRVTESALRGVAAIPIIILTILSIRQTTFWDSSSSMFERTLLLYPQSVAARTTLASFDKQRGRYDHAIKLLRDGLSYGDNLQLRMSLGSVYAKQGRVEDAQEQFEKAAALDEKNPEPLVAIGVLDEYRGNADAAAAKYRKAVELDRSYVSARNKLATILFEQKKYDEAEEQFRIALEWNPNAEGVLYNLSLILDLQNKRDEALTMLERANALLPGDPMIVKALEEHRRQQ